MFVGLANAWLRKIHLSHLALVCGKCSQNLPLLLLGHLEEVKGSPKFGRDFVEFGGRDLQFAVRFFQAERPALINIWASWCIPCRQEAPVLEQAAARHPEVRFVGINVRDGNRDALAFIHRYQQSYLNLDDPDDHAWSAFQATGVPESFLIGGARDQPRPPARRSPTGVDPLRKHGRVELTRFR